MSEMSNKAKRALEAQNKEWIASQVKKSMDVWERKHPQPDEDESGINAIFRWEELREEEEEKAEEYFTEKADEYLEEQLEKYEMDLDDTELEKQFSIYQTE